jgi:hypothetical protein
MLAGACFFMFHKFLGLMEKMEKNKMQVNTRFFNYKNAKNKAAAFSKLEKLAALCNLFILGLS